MARATMYAWFLLNLNFYLMTVARVSWFHQRVSSYVDCIKKIALFRRLKSTIKRPCLIRLSCGGLWKNRSPAFQQNSAVKKKKKTIIDFRCRTWSRKSRPVLSTYNVKRVNTDITLWHGGKTLTQLSTPFVDQSQ